MILIMGKQSELATPDNSDEESGDAFTDGDFGDSDDDTVVKLNGNIEANIPVHETVNANTMSVRDNTFNAHENGLCDHTKVNTFGDVIVDKLEDPNATENGIVGDLLALHVQQNPSIVGFLGDQQNYAEQRLAARRAARAEAREIRMRELERQQREQENNADKAYDMYSETVGRRGTNRLAALSPGVLHSPRRSSEDSADDTFNIKDLRHELKEVEEKFRKAMILNAQLDNDKAALVYQLELLKDRIEELHEEYAQLQREHKEKCSAHERLKREHASLERDLNAARDAIRARDSAANAAGYAFIEATPDTVPGGDTYGSVPPLALVSHQSEQLLNDVGEGTLDVRLQKLLSSKLSLESEVRKLKLQLNEERSARQNGIANHHDEEYENELEAARRSASEAKARAARAEAEAALHAAAAARLEGQLRLARARRDSHEHTEEQLKQERRRLQREAREALNRVEELETENSHLTKRLDKLKNAKSALLKEL